MEPLLSLMERLHEQKDEAVANLCATPHVRPVAASAFVAAVDTSEWFDNHRGAASQKPIPTTPVGLPRKVLRRGTRPVLLSTR